MLFTHFTKHLFPQKKTSEKSPKVVVARQEKTFPGESIVLTCPPTRIPMLADNVETTRRSCTRAGFMFVLLVKCWWWLLKRNSVYWFCIG